MNPTVIAILAVYILLAIPLGYVAWALCRAAGRGDQQFDAN